MRSKLGLIVGLVPALLLACTGKVDDGTRRAVDLNGDGIPDAPPPIGANNLGGSGVNGGRAGAGASPSMGGNGATLPPGAGMLPAPTLRRLTLAQYQNSVRDLLGVEADVSGLTAIPPLNGLLSIGASTVTLPQVDIEAFDALADKLAAQVFSDATARQKLTGCDAMQSACADGFVTSFGRRVFRRPLTDDERTRYLALLHRAVEMTTDGWLGLRVMTSALLQSPNFLYREEIGAADAGSPARRLLTDYELASRLSFFLWNTTPDPALLDAAESGALASSSGLAEQVDRLLASPRAADAIESLFADYLRLDALDSLVKLPNVYPQATPALAVAMKEETLRSLRAQLFERAGDFREIFTTTKTFANGDLAKLYGLRAPTGTAFSEVELPATGPRAGLLTQASFLATHAHPGRTSPTIRGKFIRENLLCQGIPAPPDNVDTTLPDTSTAKTIRDKLARHRADVACAGCHNLMDPLGLALEEFDGIGAHRTMENGVAIDASGELDGVTFTGARGLGDALAGSPVVSECFVRTVLRYARGTVEDGSEGGLIMTLHTAFTSAGYRLPALMEQIATDPSFRQVGALQ